MFRAGAGTLVFLLPLLLQVVFGLSAAVSGSITFATALGSMSMKMTARPILKRFGFRNVILINGAISALSVAMCAFFTASTPLMVIFALLVVAGFFQSLQFTATQAIGLCGCRAAANEHRDQHRQHGAAVEPGLRHRGRRRPCCICRWSGAAERRSAMPILSLPLRARRRWRFSASAFAGACRTTPRPKSAATDRRLRV